MSEANNGKKGGLLEGKLHSECDDNGCGIKAIITDQNNTPVELESGELIVNKTTANDPRKFTVEGTPKEIISALNSMDGNGVVIEDGAKMIDANGNERQFKEGGIIPDQEFIKIPASKLSIGDYLKSAYSSVKVLNIKSTPKRIKVWYETAPDTKNAYKSDDLWWTFPINETVSIMKTNKKLNEGGTAGSKSNGEFSPMHVTNWNEIPFAWRNISPIKQVNYTVSPTDPDFQDLIFSFISDDTLRPVMMGINYRDGVLEATDAHRVISVPTTETGLEGVYANKKLTAAAQKSDYLKTQITPDGKIDGKFPNIPPVVPVNDIAHSYKFDVYKLLQYTKTALNYTNQTSKQVRYKVNDTVDVALNGALLIDLLTTSLKMGHEELYFHYSAENSATVFTANPTLKINEFYMLLMPVMINRRDDDKDDWWYNDYAYDLDFGYGMSPHFDFSKNSVVNDDGSLVEFEMKYGAPTVFTKDIISLIKKFRSRNNTLPILDAFIVKDKTLTVSDLENTVEITGIDVPDNTYEVKNNAIMVVDYNIEDYPNKPVLSDNLDVHVTIDSEYFKYVTNTLKDFLSKDDLRPVMSGINFNKTYNGIRFVATDAHVLGRLNADDFVTDHKGNLFDVILPTKVLIEFNKIVEEPTDIKASNSNAEYKSGRFTLTSRLIDGKYPNYEAVVPSALPNKITTSVPDLLSTLKSKKVTDFTRKFKKEGSAPQIALKPTKTKLEGEIYAAKRENRETTVLGIESIIDQQAEFSSNAGFSLSNDDILLIMPIKLVDSIDMTIGFSPEILKKAISKLSGKEFDWYYSEPSRATIIQGNAFKYVPKKKSKPRKITKKKVAPAKELTSKEISHRPFVKKVGEKITYIRGGREWTNDIEKVTDQGYIVESFGTYKTIGFNEVIEPKKADVKNDSHSDISDVIEGLKIVGEDLAGAERKEIEDLIAGLRLLLDDDLPFEEGGEVKVPRSNQIIVEVNHGDYSENIIITKSNIKEFMTLIRNEEVPSIDLINGSEEDFYNLIYTIPKRLTKRVDKLHQYERELEDLENEQSDNLGYSFSQSKADSLEKKLTTKQNQIDKTTSSLNIDELLAYSEGLPIEDYLELKIYDETQTKLQEGGEIGNKFHTIVFWLDGSTDSFQTYDLMTEQRLSDKYGDEWLAHAKFVSFPMSDSEKGDDMDTAIFVGKVQFAELFDEFSVFGNPESSEDCQITGQLNDGTEICYDQTERKWNKVH